MSHRKKKNHDNNKIKIAMTPRHEKVYQKTDVNEFLNHPYYNIRCTKIKLFKYWEQAIVPVREFFSNKASEALVLHMDIEVIATLFQMIYDSYKDVNDAASDILFGTVSRFYTEDVINNKVRPIVLDHDKNAGEQAKKNGNTCLSLYVNKDIEKCHEQYLLLLDHLIAQFITLKNQYMYVFDHKEFKHDFSEKEIKKLTNFVQSIQNTLFDTAKEFVLNQTKQCKTNDYQLPGKSSWQNWKRLNIILKPQINEDATTGCRSKEND